MAQQTLRQILDDIAAYVDQDTTIASGTELTKRVNLVDQALKEWGNAYQWKQLRRSFSPSFGLSSVSLGLPTTYKKLMTPLWDMSTIPATKYIEINPSDRGDKLASDKYCYLSGDDAIGFSLQINPGLPSGASLVMDLQHFPSGMATLQDISVCPQPLFLSKRVVGLIFEQRADSRFPQLKADANVLLQTMIEEEVAPSGGMNNQIPNLFKSTGFRIGRD